MTTRADLATWIGDEFGELIEAGDLCAGDGELTGSFANSITKALREMGYTLVSEVTTSEAPELYDLAELYALERIVNALASRFDFSADGSSFKLSQQYEAAVARYERQQAKCGTLYGLGGSTPAVVARTLTIGALTEESLEYDTWF